MTCGSVAANSIEPASQADVHAHRPLRRLSRQVAADSVANGDLMAVVIGGLLPALIYAIIGNVKLD